MVSGSRRSDIVRIEFKKHNNSARVLSITSVNTITLCRPISMATQKNREIGKWRMSLIQHLPWVYLHLFNHCNGRSSEDVSRKAVQGLSKTTHLISTFCDKPGVHSVVMCCFAHELFGILPAFFRKVLETGNSST